MSSIRTHDFLQRPRQRHSIRSRDIRVTIARARARVKRLHFSSFCASKFLPSFRAKNCSKTSHISYHLSHHHHRLFSALKGEEEEKHRFKDVASIGFSSRFSQKVLQEVRRRGGESKETRGPDDRHTEREARGSDGEETNQRRGRFWRRRD